ncbi:uncharacterized protein [Amphiura filiformis]|uniref:uncharacterized protein n=1 Tax=Amphiura filiformis TaxID=82378 RepID=UPI003B220FC9
MERNNTAVAFQTIRDLTKKKAGRTTVIEDKDGHLLTEKKEISNRWKEYCEELYNYNLTSDHNLLNRLKAMANTEQEEDPPILTSEVEEAMRNMKDGRSPGIDNVQAEMLKSGGQTTIKAYTKLCNESTGQPEELSDLTRRLDDSARRLVMEISAAKSKVLKMGSDEIVEVHVGGEELETVTQFKYLGATITDDAKSVQEIKIRIAVATSSLANLKPIWRDKNISMAARMSLLRALVISVFLYGCETWTLNAEMEKRINAFEMNCMRRLLQVHYSTHTTNKQVRAMMESFIGEHEHLISIVKRR